MLDTLRKDCQLSETSIIADIGSGTGILTELFLQNGNDVLAVEPNPEMREAGQRLLQHYSRLQSIAGTAEATTLAERSVDFVTAGQAFHWFDRPKAKLEFLRILKPQGWVMLVWNERQTATAFLTAYEQLLQTYATDYDKVDHKQIDFQVLEKFFEPLGFKTKTFANRQEFDFASLQGRLLSSSYAPEVGHPKHEAMLAELSRIFQAHQVNGKVTFEYLTMMYYGQLQDRGSGPMI
ncbi:MAG: Ubiquinone/menaquinone biosynthesis C-methyltransferase UbiE [bacterium]|nr:Ubiquinone/menaquinone biosynthesis C-methyltransferase UbiE [bacterium]